MKRRRRTARKRNRQRLPGVRKGLFAVQPPGNSSSKGSGRPGAKPSNGNARADGVVLVSGNQLSRHLGISRQAVDALAAQQVVVRRSDGLFDEDQSRLKYITHLKSARRSTARSEADADFARAKAELMRMRIQEKQRIR
jgi:hypothetical protein